MVFLLILLFFFINYAGGDHLLRLRGRPKKNNSKSGIVKFRIGSEDAYKLYVLSEKLGLTKSEIMRKALDNLYRINRYKN